MISCIIQARIGSTRLPGKVMEKLTESETVLSHLMNQLQQLLKMLINIPNRVQLINFGWPILPSKMPLKHWKKQN